jgi:FkbM family methyltransferase
MLPQWLVGFFLRHRKLGRVALGMVPDVRRRISIDPIGPFEIRLRRHRSYWIRSPLAQEALMLGSLKRLIQPGDTVYDVGANVGLYTRFISRFGAGKTLAFEPMSENIALLKRNVALAQGDSDKIQVLAFAVGDTDGSELLQIDNVMSGTASLDRVLGGQASFGRKLYGYGPLTERVRVAKLDSLVFEENLPPPRVMKIDIEGAEMLALRGADRVLREHRPDLAIELHGPEMVKEVLAHLDGLGYACFAYVKDGGKYVYRRVHPQEANNLMGYDHIVASTRPEKLEAPISPFS